MSCEDLLDAVGELVDGTLTGERRRVLESHLASCAECAALVADLREIRRAAESRPVLQPPAAAWPRIARELDLQPAAEAPRRPWIPASVWMPLAAAALLAIAFGGYRLLVSPAEAPRTAVAPAAAPASADELVASVEEQLRLAEQHYEKAISGLEQLARDRQVLDPQVAESLQKNLQVIDQAIGESRAALRQQPTSEQAQQSLFDAFRTKIALLQDTIALINEMRKGNQAEAARIAEGLNKS